MKPTTSTPAAKTKKKIYNYDIQPKKVGGKYQWKQKEYGKFIRMNQA